MPLDEYTALLAREMTKTLNRAAAEETLRPTAGRKCNVKNAK
jgi:hypothetical protein